MDGIKTLRASRSNLQADVVIGSNKYGSDVTVAVQLNRNEPAVAEALASLGALLLARAQEQVNTAANESLIQAEVRTRVESSIASERTRQKKNAAARIESVKKRLEQAQRFAQDGTVNAAEVVRLIADLDREILAATA